MKKNYIFTLLLAFCFSNLSFGQEMLLNGGLEDWADGSPTGWTKAEVLTQSTDAHSGSISAVRTGGSGTKDLSQTITGVIPGNSYTVSFWYKVTAGDETDVRIWCTWKNGSTPVYHAGTSSSAGDDELRNNNGYLDNNGGVWTKHEVTVTAPADVDSFYYEVRSYSNSTAHWDDLSFVNNTVVSNQVVLEDFEGDAPVLSTENGVTATIAANPTVSAEKSMKIVTGAGQSWQGGKLMMQTNKIDMRTSDKTLSVKIWSDAARDFLLKLTDGDGGAGNDSKTYVAHTGSGWETLNADFSVSADTGQGGIVANDQYSGLTFYPLYNNNGTTAGGWYAIPDPAYTNYIDDITGIAGDAVTVDTCSNGIQDGDETGIDCGGSCGPCPAEPTDAPTTPIARNDWDVISIYSDAYASTGLTDVTWDEGTLSTEVTIASNNVLKVDFNNFLGTELSGGGVDATDMTHFHMDYWVADDFAAGQVFNPKLSNHAASAGETGAKLYTVALGAEDNKKWLSLDVELGTDFERNNILQFLLTTSATVKVGYIDNIYMYRAATASVGNNELLNISMYPNPVSDRLNISAQSTIKSAAIYNLLGKKVMSLEINKNSESINVSGLASGMYLIKYSLDNAIGTAKFIKQ